MPWGESLNKIAVIGNYLPRQCGIATFTTDLTEALRAADSDIDCFALAMNDGAEGYAYPDEVRFEISQHDAGAYRRAADFLNMSGVDVVSLQHEFGIFGGPAGSYILRLLRRLQVPVVSTLHTVLERPTGEQRQVMAELAERSERLVVMSRRGADFLRRIYGVPAHKIDFIHHGIPDVPFLDSSFHKDHFGVAGKKVMLTFGLLSQNKGIETAVRALPRIIGAHPEVVYLVLGATHPQVLKHEGERYREGLRALAHDLGVEDYLIFHNRFVSSDELIQYMGIADLYLTPYLNREQIVSGTLAYALGMGKAVVSTPYWYAEELLAEGRGVLVPFGDAEAVADAALRLLEDGAGRDAMRKQAYLLGRDMTWPSVAEHYLQSFERAACDYRPRLVPLVSEPLFREPPLRLDHLLALSDETGLLQHATYTVPNYAEGYTTDDNARALMVTLQAERLGLTPAATLRPLSRRYLAFLHYALNSQAGRFRNFLDYNRTWLEEVGSENSHGRALRALAMVLQGGEDEGMVNLAQRLFDAALPAVRAFTSPRAWALTLLGLCDYLERFRGDRTVSRTADELAERLLSLYQRVRTGRWRWFEDHLCHSNAKLAQALLKYGRLFGQSQPQAVGLEALAWLVGVQTSDEDLFAPVGSERVYRQSESKPPFDQQPIEAYATISACLEAYQATHDERWRQVAETAFGWFLGHNHLGLPLYDPESGGCRDGLQRSRVNQNQGAESTLSFLLALLELRRARQQLATPAAAAD